MNPRQRQKRPPFEESDSGNLEASFKNMLKIRRKFSCGMISAHRIVYDRKMRHSAFGSSAEQAADGHFPLRELLEDQHLLNYQLAGITPAWIYADENEKRDKEMASVINEKGYSQLALESFSAMVKINTFWVWNDADPGKGNGELLPFLKRLAKEFEQESFQYIPYNRQIVLYRKELNSGGRWSGNWIPSGMGYISKMSVGQARLSQHSFRLKITGPH